MMARPDPKLSSSGFSLIELTISMSLLSILMLVAFSLWESATRTFFLSSAKDELSAEARYCLLAITNPLRKSDGTLLSIVNNRTTTGLSGQSVRRDALSFVGVEDWSAPGAISTTDAKMVWNQYYVLYAGLQTTGILVLQTNKPPAPPYISPWSTVLDPASLSETPATNPGAVSTKMLSQSIEQFKASYIDDTQTATIELTFARRGGKKTSTRNIDERTEVKVRIRMENST